MNSKSIVIGILVVTILILGAFYFLNSQNPAEDRNSSCIVELFGDKYDVTELKAIHSGGNIFICGTDMTETYKGQHGEDTSKIERYKIN